MSVHFESAAFAVDSGEPIVIVATLWRGAMIDRYARIEFFIERTLAHCTDAAMIAELDAKTTLPRQRCKALLEALQNPALDAKSGHARKSLETVQELWDERNALCHGRFKPAATSVCLRWTAYDRGVGTPQEMRITAVQMLEKLQALDRLKTAVGSQLGAIDKLCRELAP